MEVKGHVALLMILVANPCGLNAISFQLPQAVLKPNTLRSSKRNGEVIKGLLTRVDTLEKGVLTRVETLEKGLLTRMDTLEKTLMTRVDTLEKHLNQYDQDSHTSGQLMQKVSSQMTRLDNGINSLSKTSDSLKLSITDAQTSGQTLSTHMTKLDRRLSTQLVQMDIRLAALEDLRLECPADKGYQILPTSKICLKYIIDSLTVDQAIKRCEQDTPGRRGRLVTLNTKAKIDDVNAYVKAHYPRKMFFIGLIRKTRGTVEPFHWTDGSPITESNWYVREPASIYSCVILDSDLGQKWLSTVCTTLMNAICEIPK